MASHRPITIDDYIDAAPPAGQPHLRRLHALLKRVAPRAQETIKWGTPFFVEPRFLFAFSAHKAHLSLSVTAQGLAPFRAELDAYETTENLLKMRYDQPLPEDLIQRIARQRLLAVRARKDDAFW